MSLRLNEVSAHSENKHKDGKVCNSQIYVLRPLERRRSHYTHNHCSGYTLSVRHDSEDKHVRHTNVANIPASASNKDTISKSMWNPEQPFDCPGHSQSNYLVNNSDEEKRPWKTTVCIPNSAHDKLSHTKGAHALCVERWYNLREHQHWKTDVLLSL